jgi:hypothetical protein
LNINVNNTVPTNPTVTSLNCAGVTTTAGTVNTAYSGTATIPYTGGNGLAYSTGTSIASTGVTGLTATIQPGTLTNSNGNLVLSITGTPTATGNASFAIDFGGEACTFYVNVVSVGNAVPFGFIIRWNPIIDNNLRIELNATNQEASNILIYDELGRKLISKSASELPTGGIIDINISQLPNGRTYIVKVMDKLSQIIMTKRFVK